MAEDKKDKEEIKNEEKPVVEQPTTEKSIEEEAAALDEVKPSKKDELRKMLLEDIEGYNPDDEEGSAALLIDRLNASKEQKKKLADALNSDPRLAQVLADVVSGKRGAAGALVKYFGKDFLNAEEGTPEYEEIVKAEEERKAEQDANEASKKEYEANIEKTMPEVEAYCKEKGYDVDEFLNNAWEGIVKPILSGMYSRQVCEFIDKGSNYDNDVKAALEAGEVKGRNTNIHKMEERNGDGMPKAMGSAPVKKPKKQGNDVLSLAKMA